MEPGPKISNALPENVKKYPFANSRNILNRGQVRLAGAKCAQVFRNYEKSLVIREVIRHLRTFEKQT